MTTPAEELAGLPLVEADRLARARIEEHRQAMSEWKAARVERIRAEVAAGRRLADIGREIQHPNVYTLITEEKPRKKKTEAAS